MATQENLRIVQRYLRGAWAEGDLAVVDQTCTSDVSIFLPGNPSVYRGTEAVKQLIAFVRRVFPDLFLRIEETVAEGDGVVVRWSTGGTRRDEWESGVPPTGEKVNWTGMSLYRLRDGRIVEERVEEDLRAVETRIGILVRKTGGDA